MTRLKEIRTLKGLKQSEIASLSDISVRSVIRIESGDVTPSVKTLVKLARAIGCSTDELLGMGKEGQSNGY